MSGASGHRQRIVHPAAWWVWAICLALSISTTTNPAVLIGADLIVLATVLTRRDEAPWARNLRLYVYLAAFVIVSRVLLHVLVRLKTHDTVIFPLPSVSLPSWAAGINLLGPVGAGGLIGAFLEGLRLATMLMCFAAANALANPRKLLASTPAAVRDIGTATVVALSVAPQFVQSVGRVRRAQVLRGNAAKRGRLRQVALPVLHETLERSIALAAAMESKGYGRRAALSRRDRHVSAAFNLLGIFLVCVGLYGTMQGRGIGGSVGSAPAWTSFPVLLGGLALCAVGVVIAGHTMRRSRYRPDPWGLMDAAVAASGVVTLIALRWAFAAYPAALSTPVEPLMWPQLPWVLPLALFPAAIPLLIAPVPVPTVRPSPARRANRENDDDGAPSAAVTARPASLLRGEVS